LNASGSATSAGGAQASGGAGNSGGGTTTTGGVTGESGGTDGAGGSTPCTDVQHPEHEDKPCSYWVDEAGGSDECNNPNGWLDGYCDETCGRCSGNGAGGGNNNGAGGGNNNGAGGGNNNGAGGGNNGAGGSLGNDNPWGTVTNGTNGWTSRYWDCCKQSCGWTNNAGGNPVKSCDASGDNKVGADVQSACSGGSSTTCNSMVPKVYSNAVSFGFVATHAGSGTPCGKCYQLQFTGSSHNGGSDPGSQALKDKVMIVMTANIGGDVSSDGQLDLLIPGGGTGALYGCGTAWGIQKDDPALGATYGGLRSGCNGDLNAIKSCVAQKCESLFQSRGLEEMYEGCMWYVDWFQAADNPNFVRKDVDCPQEVRSMAY
jgi:Glycosyl hydrolase family 45